MAGRVVHFEIPADDVARARGFYETAFGWTMTELPGMGYTLVSTTEVDERGLPSAPGGINGGMMQRHDTMTHPIVTIEVDDLDAALAQVEAAGGAVVQAQRPVGEAGFTAYFTDTEGNLMGLFQVPAAPPTSQEQG